MNAGTIISLCFSGVMMIIGVLTFILSQARANRKQTEEDDRELASLREGILKANMKLDTVCSTTNETRADIKALNLDITGIDKRVTIVENNLNTAFMRIDELRENIESK